MRRRRSRFAQSPPSTFGSGPLAETTLPMRLGLSVTASGVGLTNWYFRTCRGLVLDETPLTSRSAPIVVLVVATRTPEGSSNGLKLAVSVKSAMWLCSIVLCRYIAGPPCSAEPLE